MKDKTTNKTLGDLRPNGSNPRKISDEKLKMLEKSLAEFGDLSGYVFNVKTGNLVSGHQRQKVMPKDSKIVIDNKYSKPTEAGTLAEGSVLVNGERFKYREVSWNEIKEKAGTIAANQQGGEWEFPKLADFITAIDEANFPLETLGFSDKELADVMAPLGGKSNPKDDLVPPPPKIPKSKLGDMYDLGDHLVLCGDSTDPKQVALLLDGSKADLLLTDPPYGVSYIEKNAAVHGGIVKNAIGKEIKNDTLSVEEMGKLWGSLFSHADHFSDEASYYVFSPQGGELMMMMQAIHQSKWQLKHSLIWQKQQFVFGRCDYHYQHEPVLYGWKKKGTHNWYANRSQSSLLQFDKPHKSDLHPTTKPVDILEYLIGNSTKKGDTVVDLFGGSGSTLIACEKTKRHCLMIELDPMYVDVIVKRWEDFTGKKAKLISNNSSLSKSSKKHTSPEKQKSL